MRSTERTCTCALLVLLFACQHESEPKAAPVEPPPPTLAGNAKEHSLALKQISLKSTRDGFDVRVEIDNGGKGIVELRAAESASGTEAALLVETFRRGSWQREVAALGDPKRTVEVWPGGTQYGRATIPAGPRYARVVVLAKGVVGSDGTPAKGEVEVTSDAFELPADH
jgi:hypothetical protein